jgi:hypothetical protein
MDRWLVAGAFARGAAAAAAAAAAASDDESDAESDDDGDDGGSRGGGNSAAAAAGGSGGKRHRTQARIAIELALDGLEDATLRLPRKKISQFMRDRVPQYVQRILHALCRCPDTTVVIHPQRHNHFLSPASVEIFNTYRTRSRTPAIADASPAAEIVPQAVFGAGAAPAVSNGAAVEEEEEEEEEESTVPAALGNGNGLHLEFVAECIGKAISELGIGERVARYVPRLMDKVLHGTPGRFGAVTIAAGRFSNLLETLCPLKRADYVLLRHAGSTFMQALGFSCASLHNPVVPRHTLPDFETPRAKSLRENLLFSFIDGHFFVTIPWTWSVKWMWRDDGMRKLLLKSVSEQDQPEVPLNPTYTLQIVFCADGTQIMRTFARSGGVDKLCNFGVKVAEHGAYVDQLGFPQMLGYGQGGDDPLNMARLLDSPRQTQDGRSYPSVNEELAAAARDGIVCADADGANEITIKTEMHSAEQDMAANTSQLNKVGAASEMPLAWSNVSASVLRALAPILCRASNLAAASSNGAAHAFGKAAGRSGKASEDFGEGEVLCVRFGQAKIEPDDETLITAKIEQSSRRLKIRVGKHRLHYGLTDGCVHAMEIGGSEQHGRTLRFEIDLPPQCAELKGRSWCTKGVNTPIHLAASNTRGLLEIKLARGVTTALAGYGETWGDGASEQESDDNENDGAGEWQRSLCNALFEHSVAATTRDMQNTARGTIARGATRPLLPAADEGADAIFQRQVRGAMQTEANVFGAYAPLREAESSHFPVYEPSATAGAGELCLVCGKMQYLSPAAEDWGGEDGHQCESRFPVEHKEVPEPTSADDDGEEPEVYSLGGLPFANLNISALDRIWAAIDACSELDDDLEAYIPEEVLEATAEIMLKVHGSKGPSVRAAGCDPAGMVQGALHQGTAARLLLCLLMWLAIQCGVRSAFEKALLTIARVHHDQIFHTSTKTGDMKCSLWTGRAALLMWKNVEELCTYVDPATDECIWPLRLRTALAKFGFHYARSSEAMLTGNLELYGLALPKFVHHTYVATLFARILFGIKALSPSVRGRVTQPYQLMKKYLALGQTFQRLCEAWIERVHNRFKGVAVSTGRGGGIATLEGNLRSFFSLAAMRLDAKAQLHLRHSAIEIDHNTRMEHAPARPAAMGESDDAFVLDSAADESLSDAVDADVDADADAGARLGATSDEEEEESDEDAGR